MLPKIKYPLAIKLCVLSFSLLLTGCATSPPSDPNNICNVFQQYPRWYWEARDTYINWGVPISVQLAIINQESSFNGDAKTPRTYLLGFIPWSRVSSAYGYAQATDGTWRHYQEDTGKTNADRDQFGDASDFIGWYGNRAHEQLGIAKTNAEKLYLAYHEGLNGYRNGSYRKKRWLLSVARKVQRQADIYRIQLNHCKDDIPAPSVWNLWLW